MAERRIRMGDFVIDLDGESLSRDGEIVHLKPQVFSVLVYLAENAGRLVTRDAVIDHVWGHCEVDFDANLNTIMLQIRRALGDTPESPRYIETVPRKGFRVVATVADTDPARPKANRLRNWRSFAAAATLVVALASAGLVVPDTPGKYDVSADTHLVYARGKEALRNGDPEKAIELFEAAISASPGFAAAHACLALAYLARGGDGAVRHAKLQLERAEAIDALDPMTLTVAAQIALTHDRQLDKARALLDRALSQEAADSHTYLLSAWQYSATGNHRKARQAIQTALSMDPLSPHINKGAAAIYEAAGDRDTARRFSALARDLI